MDVSIEAKQLYNKAQQHCLDQAMNFLRGFSEDDLTDLMEQVFEKAHSEKTSIEAALKDIKNDLSKSLQNKYYAENYSIEKNFNPKTGNVVKIERGEATTNEFLSDAPIRKNLSPKQSREQGNNVEVAQKAIAVELRQLTGMLSKSAMDKLLSGKYEDAITDELDNGTSKDPDIKSIGQYIKKILERCRFHLVASTAMPIEDMSKFRYMRMNYDPLKVGQVPKIIDRITSFRNGRKIKTVSNLEAQQQFIEFLKQNSDLDSMFRLSFDKNEAADEAFFKMYDRIIQGGKFNKGSVLNVKDAPEIAKRKQMFVIWKNWSAWSKAIKTYGHGDGSYWNAIQGEINGTARKAGIHYILGADPDWAVKKMMDAEIRSKGKLPILTNPLNVYNQLTGALDTPMSPLLAEQTANLNALTSMAKLPFLAPLSLNDTNFGNQVLSQITKLSHWQLIVQKFKAIGAYYKNQYGGVEIPEELKKAAENVYHNIQYEIGSSARFIDAQNMGSITRKITPKFFQYVGMTPKDMGNRVGATNAAMRGLYTIKDTPWDGLDNYFKKRFNAYNISPIEWDTIRQHFTGPVGLETIRDLPEETINDIANKLGNSAIHTRNDLCRKIFAWLNSTAQETILTPGALEKALLTQGTQAGTFIGSALRLVSQFKGFMLAYTNRILMNGFVDDPSKMKFKWALSNFIYTLPLTMIGNAFYNLSHGRGLGLDPMEWNIDDWIDNFTPSLGMFAKSLNPRDQDMNSVLQLLQSPSINAITDLANIGFSGIDMARPSTGEFDQRLKNLGGKAGKLMYDMTPINSIPYLSNWWYHHAL